MMIQEIKALKALMRKAKMNLDLNSKNDTIVKCVAFNEGLEKAIKVIDDVQLDVYAKDTLARIVEAYDG